MLSTERDGMVVELVRWMSSACDGVELAEFVQSSCEDCRAHAVLSSSWLATERDGCQPRVSVLVSHNDGQARATVVVELALWC